MFLTVRVIQFRALCLSVCIHMYEELDKEDMQRDAISLPSSKVMQIWTSRNNATPKKITFSQDICTYNVTLKRVSVTTVALEKSYIF